MVQVSQIVAGSDEFWVQVESAQVSSFSAIETSRHPPGDAEVEPRGIERTVDPDRCLEPSQSRIGPPGAELLPLSVRAKDRAGGFIADENELVAASVRKAPEVHNRGVG